MTEALYKGLHQGFPKMGKTGALAPLLAYYRIIVASWDGNVAPVLTYADPAHRKNLIVVPFGDELEPDREGLIQRKNRISALRQFNRFLHTGNEETGPPSTWGRETILVWDELTTAAAAAERLALELNGGVTTEGAHIGVLGREIEATLGMFCADRLRCHRILNCHLKIIAPRAESGLRTETELQKQRKREIAALQETAYHPNMPGNLVAANLAHSFSSALLFEFNPAKKTKELSGLVIRTQPIKGYTIGCPVDVKDELPIESGLLTIFKAFGEALKP